MRMKKTCWVLLMAAITCSGVNAQKKIEQVAPQVEEPQQGKGLKRKVAIARFTNETQYAKGLFYDKENDPMGKQALDILSAKLAASGKFILLERNDLDYAVSETGDKSISPKSVGADYIIIGSITQYGRKNQGDVGVFTSSKEQIVEAAVSIRIVDVSTGLIIYSEEGKGSAEQKVKQTLGIGGRADFDATLSDKAIAAAVSQLVENIINNCTDKPWKSYFLLYDDMILISGGESQGIEPGNTFLVKKKGKTVKNPQTGMNIELPGKTVGKISVLECGGDTPETEYSIVAFTEGDIEKDKLENYFIEEER